MPSKCKQICIMDKNDGFNRGFKTHSYCKVCEKWFEKPTNPRCKCCNNLLRLNARSSKVKKKEVKKRIG